MNGRDYRTLALPLVVLLLAATSLYMLLRTHCEPCTVWSGADTREAGFIWRGVDSGPMIGCTPCWKATSPEARAVCAKATN